LIKLLFVILSGGAAIVAAPFSHKLHLQQGLACVDCHTAAATSTKAEDNLLPAKRVCLGCHEDAQIPAPPTTGVSKFNHALHLKMGNAAVYMASAIDHQNYLQPPNDIRRHLNGTNPCQACHRGLEESDQVTHAALPQMADCLVCHSQIEPPYSCEECHTNVAQLKPASHALHFADTHSSGKLNLDKTTCAVCHGRAFKCAGCH
jgi:predicted CXXCH cytochrome family protein